MRRNGKDQLKMQVVKLGCWNNRQFILQQFLKLLINLPVIIKICILQKSSKSHTSKKKENPFFEFPAALLTKPNQTQHSSTKPKQTQPKPTKSNQIKFSQTQTSSAKYNQTQTNPAKLNQNQPHPIKSSQTQQNNKNNNKLS